MNKSKGLLMPMNIEDCVLHALSAGLFMFSMFKLRGSLLSDAVLLACTSLVIVGLFSSRLRFRKWQIYQNDILGLTALISQSVITFCGLTGGHYGDWIGANSLVWAVSILSLSIVRRRTYVLLVGASLVMFVLSALYHSPEAYWRDLHWILVLQVCFLFLFNRSRIRSSGARTHSSSWFALHVIYRWGILAGTTFLLLILLFPILLLKADWKGWVPVRFELHSDEDNTYGNETIASLSGKPIPGETAPSDNGKMVRVEDPQKTLSLGGDGDGHGQSEALVMLIHSPQRCYWFQRCYYVYTGKGWKNSEGPVLLLPPDSSGDRISLLEYADSATSYRTSITQDIKVVAAGGLKTLCGGFLPISVEIDTDGLLLHKRSMALVMNRSLASGTSYSIVSSVPDVASYYRKICREVPDRGHAISRNEFNDALDLSNASERTRKMAQDIIGGEQSQWNRAVAIHKFLKENYEYYLEGLAIPDEEDAVDYFLFSQRRANCQLFGSAMVILARCAGIPARLATGYSSGDYNLLTGMYEVRQKHKHAWAQLYFSEMGWLAFDATPGFSERNRTLPLILAFLKNMDREEFEFKPILVSQAPDREDTRKAPSGVQKNAERVNKAAAQLESISYGDRALLTGLSVMEKLELGLKEKTKALKLWLLSVWEPIYAFLSSVLPTVLRIFLVLALSGVTLFLMYKITRQFWLNLALWLISFLRMMKCRHLARSSPEQGIREAYKLLRMRLGWPSEDFSCLDSRELGEILRSHGSLNTDKIDFLLRVHSLTLYSYNEVSLTDVSYFIGIAGSVPPFADVKSKAAFLQIKRL